MKETKMTTAVAETAETALAIPSDLHITRAPKEVLESAREAAVALKEVIAQRHKKVVFNGEQYLQFEDWQTVGGFFGSSVATGDAELVEIDGIPGFKAKARVIDSNGIEVSTAEAYCMKDEYNWKSKPLFQLASMAQTRAGAKALRNKFAWVAVLAGYSPTPAEEMTGDETQAADVPNCPSCEGPMWDNRQTKKGNQPDFKCKDRNCNKGIWLDSQEVEKPKRASSKGVDESRRVLVQSVADGFKVLNKLGDAPPWTKRTVNDFVALHFQGAAGVDELDDEQISDLLRMVSEKIDSLKGGPERKANIILSIKSYFDTDKHLENFMKDHGGKKLEELTIPELEKIELGVTVPF
jgi:hypothetical protein